MNPIEFPEQNIVFAKDQPEYLPLPAYKKPDGEVITVWELSDDEIDVLLRTRKLHIKMLTFNKPLMPIAPFVVPDMAYIAKNCKELGHKGSDIIDLLKTIPIEDRSIEVLISYCQACNNSGATIQQLIDHLKKEQTLPRCQGCMKRPEEIDEYVVSAREHSLTPDEYCKQEEGTFNHENGHFLCTQCYIEAGMPEHPQGWVCP